MSDSICADCLKRIPDGELHDCKSKDRKKKKHYKVLVSDRFIGEEGGEL